MELIVIAVVILMVVSNWKLFVKMGEPGWKVLIPLYSTYVLYNRVWSAGVGLAVIASAIVSYFFAPAALVTLVLAAICMHKMSKAFGKGAGTTVGLILLPFVFQPMLAFGDAQYQGPAL